MIVGIEKKCRKVWYEEYLFVQFDRRVLEQIPSGAKSTFWVEGNPGEEKIVSYNWPDSKLQ